MLLNKRQLDRVNQQSALNADAGLTGYRLGVRAPRMRQEPGTKSGTVVVHLEDPSRGASIFYTTDGWAPTAASINMRGQSQSDATVRAIAVVAAQTSVLQSDRAHRDMTIR